MWEHDFENSDGSKYSCNNRGDANNQKFVNLCGYLDYFVPTDFGTRL